MISEKRFRNDRLGLKNLPPDLLYLCIANPTELKCLLQCSKHFHCLLGSTNTDKQAMNELWKKFCLQKHLYLSSLLKFVDITQVCFKTYFYQLCKPRKKNEIKNMLFDDYFFSLVFKFKDGTNFAITDRISLDFRQDAFVLTNTLSPNLYQSICQNSKGMKLNMAATLRKRLPEKLTLKCFYRSNVRKCRKNKIWFFRFILAPHSLLDFFRLNLQNIPQDLSVDVKVTPQYIFLRIYVGENLLKPSSNTEDLNIFKIFLDRILFRNLQFCL